MERELTPEEIMEEELRKEAIEHRDMLLELREILATKSGRNFFKYLFKTLNVIELPAKGLENGDLMETIGYLRAGRAIFKLASEANADVAASLLADVEKERYAQLVANSQI